MSSETRAILERVQERAADLVKFAADKFKLKLDYTEASIARVEQALADIHKHFGATAEQHKAAIVNLSHDFGSYIGEVLRQKHGGEWRVNLPNFPPSVEGLDVDGVTLGPAQQVFLRITKGHQFNIEDFWKKAETAIAQRRTSGASAASASAKVTDPGASMRRKAAEAVADAKELFGIDLDYSEASMGRCDEALERLHNVFADKVPASERMSDDEKFLLKPVAALRYVAYLGEVCCKSLGAEWRSNIPGCRPDYVGLVIGDKLLTVELKGRQIEPRDIIVACLNDPENCSVKNYYFDLKRILQADAGLASAASFDEKMAACAQEAVAIARDRYGAKLDFSESSVKELETLLAHIHTSLPRPGDPQRPTDQRITGIAITFGAYLGEILRTNLGGKWLQHSPTAPASLPALDVRGNVVTPCRKVSKRILEGPQENVAYFYKIICDVIRNGIPSTK